MRKATSESCRISLSSSLSATVAPCERRHAIADDSPAPATRAGGAEPRAGGRPQRADVPRLRNRLGPGIIALVPAAALALGTSWCGAPPAVLSGRVTRALDGDTI